MVIVQCNVYIWEGNIDLVILIWTLLTTTVQWLGAVLWNNKETDTRG